MAISLSGPILTSYVNWVLQHCLNKKINRLYFIARDGYILKEIADILIQKNKYPITTKYIYGSRLAWRVPSIEYNEENYGDILSALLLDAENLTDATGLSAKELEDFIEKKYINKKLTIAEKAYLQDKISENKAFWGQIVRKNSEQRSLVIQYLKQEIDYSDDKFAFVDLTGSGNANNRLAKMINVFYSGKINTFYMQTNKNVAPETLVNRFCYMYTERAFMWLEILSRAPHGQTIAYKKEGQKIVPVLEDINFAAVKKWNYEKYIDGIKMYAKYYDIDVTYDVLKRYLDIIPSQDSSIISTFADQIFSCIGKHENQEFAPAFSKKEAYEYLFFNKPLQTNALHWSLYRTKSSVRRIIDFKNKYGSLRKFLINVYFSKKKKEFYIRVLGAKVSFKSLVWRKK